MIEKVEGMTPEAAVDALAGLPALASIGMSFTAICPDSDGPYSGFRIGLTEGAEADLATIAEATRKQLADATLISYGPATLVPPQHWMHVGESEAAVLRTIEEVIAKGDLKPFDGGADYAASIKMVAARFATKDQPHVTFYRVADSMLQFKKSNLYGLVREGDTYKRLEPADTLLMRAVFDVVVIGGHAFFTKKPTFERAFGFLEELKKASLATFTAVTAHLKIQGMDALRDASTSQPQMMAKMSSIKRSMDNDPAYAKAMTMDKLIHYIESHPHVDIEIVGKGKDKQLVFDTKPARRFQILKLLDDDFLRSVLTEREYEAGSKTITG